MNITNVKLSKSTSDKVKAYGHIELDNVLRINVSVLENKDGPFPVLPGYKNREGKWKTSVYFDDETLYKSVNERIIGTYRDMITNDQTATEPKGVDQTPAGNVPF